MSIPKKFPLMMVTWKDAQSCSNWKDEDECKKWTEEDCIIVNVGWIVTENKKYIVICSQVSFDKMYGDKTKIPVGWIIKRQRVKIK